MDNVEPIVEPVEVESFFEKTGIPDVESFFEKTGIPDVGKHTFEKKDLPKVNHDESGRVDDEGLAKLTDKLGKEVHSAVVMDDGSIQVWWNV